MNVLITYDLSDTNSSAKKDVKKILLDKGYFNSWTSGVDGSIITYLPESTVWKKGIEPKEAITDLNFAVDKYNAEKKTQLKILRCVAVPASPWSGYQGNPTEL